MGWDGIGWGRHGWSGMGGDGIKWGEMGRSGVGWDGTALGGQGWDGRRWDGMRKHCNKKSWDGVRKRYAEHRIYGGIVRDMSCEWAVCGSDCAHVEVSRSHSHSHSDSDTHSPSHSHPPTMIAMHRCSCSCICASVHAQPCGMRRQLTCCHAKRTSTVCTLEGPLSTKSPASGKGWPLSNGLMRGMPWWEA